MLACGFSSSAIATAIEWLLCQQSQLTVKNHKNNKSLWKLILAEAVEHYHFNQHIHIYNIVVCMCNPCSTYDLIVMTSFFIMSCWCCLVGFFAGPYFSLLKILNSLTLERAQKEGSNFIFQIFWDLISK